MPDHEPSHGAAPPAAALPLRVTGLTRRYGDVVAVNGLDLEVRPGEILGFLGPNGAGKTTTLRVCAGLLRADAGAIEVAGASLAKEPLRARARMGFVPDRAFLYERLSGREFLAFVGALYGLDTHVATRRGDELLQLFELGAASDDLIESYSLGMRQKIAIAAALLHDPPLMMLDEPLQGLDPRAARALKDLLRERATRGLGVLVSTHLLDVAERMCDRVVILHRGRLVGEGSLAALTGGRGGATLEEVFLELTRERGEPGSVSTERGTGVRPPEPGGGGERP